MEKLRAVLTAKEIAPLLGWRSVESFYNNRAKLEAGGFPPKLPGVNSWSRAAVLRWIDSNGDQAPPPAPALPRVNRLEERYA